MQDFLASILNIVGLAWWVEVITGEPQCTYYFGPFSDEKAAQAARPGYVEDLDKEGAKNIVVAVKRCKPKQLTVANDLGKYDSSQILRAL